MSALSSPANWRTVRMRDVITQQPTIEQTKALQNANQVSFLPMEAIGEQGELDLSIVRDKEIVSTGYTLFFNNDVLVAKITPCFENGKGAVARDLLNGVGFGTTELHILRPSAEIDSHFLYYVTASQPFRAMGEANMTGAAGQKRVPTEFVYNFRIHLPPLPMQRAIAAYLDRETAKIDAMIDAKQRLLALLAEKRRAMITHAVTRGLDADAPMRDSGVPWIGEVPEEWEVIQLRFAILGIDTGFSPQCYNFPAQPGEWGVLKTGCVNGGVFHPDENKTLPIDIVPPLELEVKSGDVLMSRASGSVNLIGSVALVENQPSARLLLSDKIFRIKINSNVCDAKFFVRTMSSFFVRQQISQIISGAEGLANNVAQADIRDLLLPLPPIGEQKIITDFIEQKIKILDTLYKKTTQTVERLHERRAAIIAAAVTGNIDVTE